jgi:NADPH:quinone reductase and related Zn-dependent oxidoreductases
MRAYRIYSGRGEQALERIERASAPLGADATINYVEHPAWDEKVLELTGGRGVDLVVEVGGHATLNRSVKATRTGGTLALVGGVSGFASQLEIVPLLVDAKRLVGIAVGSRAMLADLSRFVERARMQPAVDRVFAFDQTPEAYAYLESGRNFGKVVIEVKR